MSESQTPRQGKRIAAPKPFTNNNTTNKWERINTGSEQVL